MYDKYCFLFKEHMLSVVKGVPWRDSPIIMSNINELSKFFKEGCNIVIEVKANKAAKLAKRWFRPVGGKPRTDY